MKYLCLVYLDGPKLDALPEPEKRAIDVDSQRYDKELAERGHYITSDALQPPDTAVTVRVRKGQVSTTDGPFAETKEQLGGFILIEARDLNEALRLAADIPLAKHGSIEVRPIMTIETLI
jgi:hypothetical protein